MLLALVYNISYIQLLWKRNLIGNFLDNVSTVSVYLPTHESSKNIVIRFIMGATLTKQNLSENDLDFLQRKTREDKDTIKEQYAVFKEECPNGKLTLVGFVDAYKGIFPTQNGEEFCKHVFRVFDADNNGFLDFKEYILAINFTSKRSAEEKLKWAFKMYDVDGDGFIDRLEITKVLQAMCNACDVNDTTPTNVSRKEKYEGLRNIFNLLDENEGAGLTEGEFVAACLQDDNLSTLLLPPFLQ